MEQKWSQLSRTISVHSCCSKLFTTLVQKQLLNHLDANNKLSQFQAAFRPRFSTLDYYFTLKSLINKYVTAFRSKFYTCFVELHRTFDRIWREDLLLKLVYFRIGEHFSDIVKNMYESNSCQINFPLGIHESFTIKLGIKQRYGLNPLTIFLITIFSLTIFLIY